MPNLNKGFVRRCFYRSTQPLRVMVTGLVLSREKNRIPFISIQILPNGSPQSTSVPLPWILNTLYSIVPLGPGNQGTGHRSLSAIATCCTCYQEDFGLRYSRLGFRRNFTTLFSVRKEQIKPISCKVMTENFFSKDKKWAMKLERGFSWNYASYLNRTLFHGTQRHTRGNTEIHTS